MNTSIFVLQYLDMFYAMKKVNLLLGFVGLSLMTFAQVNEVVKIGEVLVADSLQENKNTINFDEKSKAPKSISEAMTGVPGLTTAKRSGFSEEAVIASFKTDQINTVKDNGQKASTSCANRMDPITTRITPEQLQKIEIITGPYDLRYGQVLGGVVRLISSEPLYYDTWKVHGRAMMQYNSNGNGLQGGYQINTGNKNLAFSTFATYRKFSNYKSGSKSSDTIHSNQEIASALETFNAGAKLGYLIHKNHSIVADWSTSQARDVLHAGLPMDANHDKGHMASLTYRFSPKSRWIKQIELNMYGAGEDHLMSNALRPNATIMLADAQVYSENFGGKLEWTSDIKSNLKLFMGADYQYEHKDGKRLVEMYKNVCTTPPTVFPKPVHKEFSIWQNSHLSDMGAYLQTKWHFSSKNSIEGGLRMDYVQSQILSPETDFLALYQQDLNSDPNLNINAFASANINVFHQTFVKISVGQGTRHASLLERYINHFTVGADAYEYVGNPNLKSETNRQIDLGVESKFKSIQVNANVYFSQVSDYIMGQLDTTIAKKFTPCKDPKFTKRFVNVEQVRQIGISLGFDWKILKTLTIAYQMAYVDAQNLTWNEPLSETPPLFMGLQVKYQYKNLSLKLANEYQAMQNKIAASIGEKETPEFYVMNIDASYRFFESLDLGFAIDNVFDALYYRHLSRPYQNMETNMSFFEPGRSFNVYLKYKF